MPVTFDQIVLFAVVSAVFVLLIWGRFRYDVVAFGGLSVAAVLGVVPKEQIFAGFGHPAVVIVALVLVVSRGLSRSGAIDWLSRRVIDTSRGLAAHVGIMAGVSAALSTVMNNVAALALLMPLDVQAARKAKRSPALTLMPISFASILGGMVTLIGTPPNIVIATFREESLGEPYGMFDFAPVGAVVAVVGVLYVALIGWRLVPEVRTRYDAVQELAELGGYVAEVRMSESSPFLGRRLKDLQALADDNEVHLLGLVRRGRRLPGSGLEEELRKSDFLVVEGAPDAIHDLAGAANLELSAPRRKSRLDSEGLDMVVHCPQVWLCFAGSFRIQHFKTREPICDTFVIDRLEYTELRFFYCSDQLTTNAVRDLICVGKFQHHSIALLAVQRFGTPGLVVHTGMQHTAITGRLMHCGSGFLFQYCDREIRAFQSQLPCGCQADNPSPGDQDIKCWGVVCHGLNSWRVQYKIKCH
jgi:hypothetical protein